MLVTMMVILIVMFALGVPIAISMGVAGFVGILLTGNIPLEVTAQRFMTGVDSFPLLAVPFFILAGALMNAGGVTERLVRLANALVGHLTGGLGHVVVVTNMIMAGMSGSASADAAGTGAVLIPSMVRAGFAPNFSAAVTASASTIGPIIPPSIPFVMYGVLASVSIGRLFLGGAIPGVLMGIYLMVVVYLISKKRGYARGQKATCGSLTKAFWEGLPALMLPVIILWGIVGGVVTPTEAAVLAVLWALFLGLFVYRELTLASMHQVFGEAALTTGAIMFIVAASQLLAWMLTREQAGPLLVNSVTSITTDPKLVLLAINIILLILGCFLETLSIMIILVPVLMPLIHNVGIDPVHFGVVLTLNLMIGLITPPVGMAMFIACSIAKIKVIDFAKEIVPFMVALILVLLAITYIPDLVLFLPNLLMGN
ncbi:MAG: TRAP transporter large permease [Chloroflexi bacterium]|nr:TRAP transporter large permease [Chloroflexota bacterium]